VGEIVNVASPRYLNVADALQYHREDDVVQEEERSSMVDVEGIGFIESLG
jgi:hypothetical protein